MTNLSDIIKSNDVTNPSKPHNLTSLDSVNRATELLPHDDHDFLVDLESDEALYNQMIDHLYRKREAFNTLFDREFSILFAALTNTVKEDKCYNPEERLLRAAYYEKLRSHTLALHSQRDTQSMKRMLAGVLPTSVMYCNCALCQQLALKAKYTEAECF